VFRTTIKRQLRLRSVLLLAVLLTALSGSTAAYKYATRDTDPIPSGLRAQLTFSPLVLQQKAKYFTADAYKFSSAEGNVQILSYLIHPQDQSTISVSEYVQPSEFTDIPEYKDRFLTNVAQQYTTVETSNGTIFLGRLSRQHNEQLGIMIEHGLLIFMNPNKELSAATWRNLGDQLQVQKIIN
jgi:hypothetical protein